MVQFISLDEYNVHSVTLSIESVTLYEKRELVSMDNVGLLVKSEIFNGSMDDVYLYKANYFL